ncbi:unnamed protein product, partial [Meganyctiphanes norvegica]
MTLVKFVVILAVFELCIGIPVDVPAHDLEDEDDIHPHVHARKYQRPDDISQKYWNDEAQKELKEALALELNTNVAKNVILFLGDGMSIPTLTAARVYKGQQLLQSGEEGNLVFEKFDHVGLSKTYNVNKQVPDSAGTGTAYLTGVKTNYKMIGVDARVQYNECKTQVEGTNLYSIIKWAQDAGKKTGVITSTRITHATPAATYAHVANRNWESECNIDEENKKNCPRLKDIARQLVEDEPGSKINVIMGGGFQCFDANITVIPGDPEDPDPNACERQDGRQLWKDWIKNKEKQGVKHAFVRNKSQLNKVKDDTEFLMALFANGHIPYEHVKREKHMDLPTLPEMTEKAIKMLSNPEGFVLLVEGGRIDHAHHDTKAHRALDETIFLDQAVEHAMHLTKKEDTLIVVTADHSHTMTINGYPERGQDILGFAGVADDGLPYTTLMYANGPGSNYTVAVDDTGVYSSVRLNLTGAPINSWEYTQMSTVPRESETHGGDDVAIYASGPMSHLFHNNHEQNYIAHAMAYAACIGANRDHCKNRHSHSNRAHRKRQKSAASKQVVINIMMLNVIVITWILL